MGRMKLLATCAGLLLGGLATGAWAEVGSSSTGLPATLFDQELGSADAVRRLYAVKMLGRLAAMETHVSDLSEVVERLDRAARDSNPDVAAQARRELERLAGLPTPARAGSGLNAGRAQEQARDLGSGLGAPDPGRRLYTVKALGRLARSGAPVPLAVALLQVAVRDRSLGVAAQAEAELALLEGGPVAVRAKPPTTPSDIEDYAALYFSSSDVGERLRAVKRLTALAARHKGNVEIARVLKAAEADNNAIVSAQARSASARGRP